MGRGATPISFEGVCRMKFWFRHTYIHILFQQKYPSVLKNRLRNAKKIPVSIDFFCCCWKLTNVYRFLALKTIYVGSKSLYTLCRDYPQEYNKDSLGCINNMSAPTNMPTHACTNKYSYTLGFLINMAPANHTLLLEW